MVNTESLIQYRNPAVVEYMLLRLVRVSSTSEFTTYPNPPLLADPSVNVDPVSANFESDVARRKPPVSPI